MRLPFLFLKAKDGEAKATRESRSRRLAGAAETSAEDIQAARGRARRRLIGAAVLLVVGVVVFPMLFETEPRPLPLDTPIDASRVDGNPNRVASGTVEAQRPPEVPPPDAGNEVPAGTSASASAPSSTPLPATVAAAITSSPAVSPPSAPVVVAKPTPAPAPVPAAKPPAAAAARGAATAPDSSPSASAIASGNSLEASAAQASAPRFVVQVGAFNEVQRMREARAKVEKLGYKTYITEVDSSSGKRTRVRLGPFASRDEAEAAAAKVKTVGLPANIYQL